MILIKTKLRTTNTTNETDHLEPNNPNKHGSFFDPELGNHIPPIPPPEYRADVVSEKMDCLDVVIFVGYSIFWLFINLCPIIAQIKLIYTLCYYDKYYNGPDSFQNKLNVVARYFNTYFIGHLIWDYFKFMFTNFSSEVKWKKYLARTMCGYIILDIYIYLFKHLYRLTYYNKTMGFDDRQSHGSKYYDKKYSVIQRIFGYLGFLIVTFGISSIFYVFEYISVVLETMFGRRFSPKSSQHKIGTFMTSLVTGGLYGLYELAFHKNIFLRLLAKVILIGYNVGIGAAIYYAHNETYVLIILCTVSLPVIYVIYRLLTSFTFVRATRVVMNAISYGYFRFCHLCDVAYFKIRQGLVRCRNRIVNSHTNTKNRLYAFTANFYNVRIRRVRRQPILVVGMEGYRTPVVHQFVPITARTILEFSVKLAERNTRLDKEIKLYHHKLFYECLKSLITQKFKNTYDRDICSIDKYYVSAYNNQKMSMYKEFIDTIIDKVNFPETVEFGVNYRKYYNLIGQLNKTIRICGNETAPPQYMDNINFSTIYYNESTGLLNINNINNYFALLTFGSDQSDQSDQRVLIVV